jgi:hypothetical protein
MSFVGGNDLIVMQQAMVGTATTLRLCTSDGSCLPPIYLPPPSTSGWYDVTLRDAILAGKAPVNLTVELVDQSSLSVVATKSF